MRSRFTLQRPYRSHCLTDRVERQSSARRYQREPQKVLLLTPFAALTKPARFSFPSTHTPIVSPRASNNIRYSFYLSAPTWGAHSTVIRGTSPHPPCTRSIRDLSRIRTPAVRDRAAETWYSSLRNGADGRSVGAALGKSAPHCRKGGTGGGQQKRLPEPHNANRCLLSYTGGTDGRDRMRALRHARTRN